MQRVSQRTAFRAAAVALALCAAAGVQAQQVNFTKPYIGIAVGPTDLDNAVRVFGGGQFTNIFGIEGQIASYGSKTYTQGFYTYKDSAWTTGVYGTATMPVVSTLSVFAKAGVHYFNFKSEGADRTKENGSLELGLGVGIKWQTIPEMAVRFDYENIGGSGGDIISVGVQFPLNF